MRKILYIIVFLLSLNFYSQGDFRKMKWGDSVSDLKKMYTNILFDEEIDNQSGFIVMTHNGNLVGIDVKIIYIFSNNRLIAGMYDLEAPAGIDYRKTRIKNFNTISERLTSKYNMERQDKWVVQNKSELYRAVDNGDVTLIEKAVGKDFFPVGGESIIHTLGRDANNLFKHQIVYASAEMQSIANQQKDDEF